MHVAVLNQVYWPDSAATSQLMTELAEGLVGRGHRVTVLCARTANTPGTDTPAPRREVRRGVHVRRLDATRLGKRSLVTRAADYGSFYAGAIAALATMRPAPDVVLALSTPPLIPAAAQLGMAPRALLPSGRPAIVSLVQDVYPDIAVALGVVPPDSAVERAWRTAAGLSLRASDRVIVLSQAMAHRVRGYGVREERLRVVSNWALSELVDRPPADPGPFRKAHGYGDAFTVVYSGNLGAGHSFDTVLDAASALREGGGPEVRLVFIGGGVRRAEVEAGVAERGLEGIVRFMPLLPLEELPASMRAADAHLVTMRDGIEGLLMPSKLYGILAAERPVVFVGPRGSEIDRLMRDTGAGVSYANGDVDGLVAGLRHMAEDHEARRVMGASARALADGPFHREVAVAAYEQVLREAIAEARGETDDAFDRDAGVAATKGDVAQADGLRTRHDGRGAAHRRSGARRTG